MRQMSTLPHPIASEVSTLWRYTNLFIIIIIIIIIIINHGFLGPHESAPPQKNGISIASSVSAWLTVAATKTADQLADHATRSVATERI